MPRQLQAKVEARALRKALGRSPLDRPAFTEPAPPLELHIESTKHQQLADATAALVLLEQATRMIGDARTQLLLAGVGAANPAAVYASRAVDEALKAAQGTRYVLKTLKR